MAMMDPAMRERIKQRLAAAGINTDAITAGGEDANALLKPDERARASAGRDGRIAAIAKGAQQFRQGGARRQISLEKAWHGVHYLLCAKSSPAPQFRVGQ